MSKQKKLPDWNTAPEWAQYFAIDDDGTGCWYEIAPKIRLSHGAWNNVHSTKWEYIGKFDATNWEKSLQQRPQNII